ncbi:histidine phosphatase family protein [Marinibacterium profundimaris]|uniref:Phosphoglycerate mutase n=1 Tax=Marinibacterium profundimaris TaxID=1679460 RepID=A0A225ND16_9RHOB|nr:histidine phosphatase family protein [Marinibacterium profundimaris]OWU69506.1 phosphoglycerate mutase [Marinibacterium profundimaris]
MTRLALLRHGHTEWNRAGRIQGRSDIMLDAEARDELSAQRLPAPWDEAMLWSSPLERALDTAELVSGGQRPKAAPELIEMAWGDWEGQKGADLLADPGTHYSDIENWGWDFEPPGGETPRAVAERLTPWLAGLEGDNVAVCHIGVMRVILALAHDWDFDGPAPFKVKRNRLYVISIEGDRLVPEGEPVRLEPAP